MSRPNLIPGPTGYCRTLFNALGSGLKLIFLTTTRIGPGISATERGALREACVSSLNRSYFRREYSPSPVVSGQLQLIPDLWIEARQ